MVHFIFHLPIKRRQLAMLCRGRGLLQGRTQVVVRLAWLDPMTAIFARFEWLLCCCLCLASFFFCSIPPFFFERRWLIFLRTNLGSVLELLLWTLGLAWSLVAPLPTVKCTTTLVLNQAMQMPAPTLHPPALKSFWVVNSWLEISPTTVPPRPPRTRAWKRFPPPPHLLVLAYGAAMEATIWTMVFATHLNGAESRAALATNRAVLITMSAHFIPLPFIASRHATRTTTHKTSAPNMYPLALARLSWVDHCCWYHCC